MIPSIAYSLDKHVDDDPGSRSFGDFLVDPQPGQDQMAYQAEVEERLRLALSSISDKRIKFILTRRFGLDGKDEQTLEGIAETMNLSRERIRQLEVIGKRLLYESVFLRPMLAGWAWEK